MSGFWGSTVTRQKYQLRFVSRGSLPARRQVAPPSSERYSPPPAFAPIRAYTRPPRATASPIRPTGPAGSPCPVSAVHVAPPSVDLYRPLPGPSSGGYCSHGVRRAWYSAAYTTWGSAGSAARSMAPVSGSLYSTLAHVRPPSVERNTPRSLLGPYACPSAATSTSPEFRGSTSTLPMWRVSARPSDCQCAPPSVDLYTPVP